MESKYLRCAYNKADGEKCVHRICSECERFGFIDYYGNVHCKCVSADCESCEEYISNSEVRAAAKAESLCNTCMCDCDKSGRVSFCRFYMDKYTAAPPDFNYCGVCIHTCKHGGWCQNFSVKKV